MGHNLAVVNIEKRQKKSQRRRKASKVSTDTTFFELDDCQPCVTLMINKLYGKIAAFRTYEV